MFCWFPTFKLYASFPSTSRTKVEFWGFHSSWSCWTFSDYGEISCAGWYQLGSIYDMTINDNLWNKVTKRCNHIDRTRDQVPVRPLELSAADHIAVALSCWSLSPHFWSSSGEDSWEFVLGANRILLETLKPFEFWYTCTYLLKKKPLQVNKVGLPGQMQLHVMVMMMMFMLEP